MVEARDLCIIKASNIFFHLAPVYIGCHCLVQIVFELREYVKICTYICNMHPSSVKF